MFQVNVIAKRLRSTLRDYIEATYHIWDEALISKRRDLLNAPGTVASDLYLEGSPRYEDGRHISDLQIPSLAARFLEHLSSVKGTGVWPNPRSHQCEAIEEFLGKGNDIIVASGTGSGKTESFLYPLLGSFAMESTRPRRSAMESGLRVLLLYPMNALVNDQLGRLRAMFGHPAVSDALKEALQRRVTFGVYTSRTPYPGVRTEKKDKKWCDVYRNNYPSDTQRQEQLRAERMWPAKSDLEEFISSGLHTDDDDSELMTRHEMQAKAPDLMVTNYSMLEYMLARPIEQPIFDQTASWLSMHEDNFLTIVLDEAHVYRGVGGTEVAYLIRRLANRLGLPNGSPKLRFIVTTASLGSVDNAEEAKRFVTNLTGAPSSRFTLINSKKFTYVSTRRAVPGELESLCKINLESLGDALVTAEALYTACASVISGLMERPLSADSKYSIDILRSEIYQFLEGFGPAKLLSNLLTEGAQQKDFLVEQIFGSIDERAQRAFDALLFLMVYGQERGSKVSGDGRIFQPVRLHALFRGVPGLYACLNPTCSSDTQSQASPNPLGVGRVYVNQQNSCVCGAKVYEIFTHRKCGAAFIRAFYSESKRDFLLGSDARGFSESTLRECHLSIEPEDRINVRQRTYWYLDWRTGKLSRKPPDSELGSRSTRKLYVSDDTDVEIGQRRMWTFKSCPVCKSRCVHEGVTKIQDLATKGEEPLAYLIREQISSQTPNKESSRQFPLGGRKSLVFSDGRQKAARLARDMPETIARQVFRACLIDSLILLRRRYEHSPRYMNRGQTIREMYGAFVVSSYQRNISVFNSDPSSEKSLEDDWRLLSDYISTLCEDDPKDLSNPDSFNDFLLRLSDTSRPRMFDRLLLENFCHEYYSLPSFSIVVFLPSKEVFTRIRRGFAEIAISDEDLVSLLHNWIHAVMQRDWAYSDFSKRIRLEARGNFGGKVFGYRAPSKPGQRGVYDLLGDEITLEQRANLERTVLKEMCIQSSGEGGNYFLKPEAVFVELSPDPTWYQCNECTKLFYKPLFGRCPHGKCKSTSYRKMDVDSNAYLRARKGFYRDPLMSASRRNELLPLSVEEHTAQLSYRDDGDVGSTSERHERRFKDILLDPRDRPIDVLSCTTTMEVGVDIGSLVAVAMRNVPPARQNYQQRAGRAGRRGSSVSTVLTYAQNGSHDSYYFDHPGKLISGPPVLPKIDIENEKIVTRHVHAALIQSFFHRQKTPDLSQSDLMSVLGATADFYNKDSDFSLKRFESFVDEQISTGSIRQLLSWIPETTFVDHTSAAKDLVSALHLLRPDNLEDGDGFEEHLLNFLFYEDLLPTYAFPRNIVELRIENNQSHTVETIEKPQQSLATALTEYAPRRATVVNKDTYIIGTVAAKTSASEVNRAVRLFQKRKIYFQCATCAYTEELAAEARPNVGVTCKHCGSPNTAVLDVIQPEVVYPARNDGEGPQGEDSDEDTYTRATSAQLPFVEGHDSAGQIEFSKTATISTQADQRLVMLNKGEPTEKGFSGFYVCRLCGKADLKKPNGSQRHGRDYKVSGPMAANTACLGLFENVSLGYSFNSDVFLMRIDLAEGLIRGNSRLELHALMSAGRTLAEAMMRSATLHFDSENGELDCGVRRLILDGKPVLDIFIYDTTAGGAGYSRRIGDSPRIIFDGAMKFLSGDCCDDSCYQCLRDFRNRFSHDQLHKAVGLDLWHYVHEGLVPKPYEIATQEIVGRPLLHLMELLGYESRPTGGDFLELVKGGDRRAIVIYPVLTETPLVMSRGSQAAVPISDFEIRHSLSGAFDKVQSN
jgi:hypothetical protein